MTFDALCELCEDNSHWLSFDLDALQQRYKIGKKVFGSTLTAANEVRRLVVAREAMLAL